MNSLRLLQLKGAPNQTLLLWFSNTKQVFERGLLF